MERSPRSAPPRPPIPPSAMSPSRAISATRRRCAPGCAFARGVAVIVMDADFEHPPELIPELVARWRAGASIVATQRNDDAAPVSAGKRLSSRLYYRLLDAHRRRAHRARQRRLHAARPRRGRRRQRPRRPGHLPARAGALARLSDGDGAVHRAACGARATANISLRRMVELAVTGIAAHSVRPLRFAVWLSLALRHRWACCS